MKHQILLATAFSSIVAAGFSANTYSAEPSKEKCFGIAKAGQNDCVNLSESHSCAGQAKTDNDKGEWKLVANGSCKSLGGISLTEAKTLFATAKKS
ncbi:MAG: DUF2282 domain-containing protein [Methylotenera sp.]